MTTIRSSRDYIYIHIVIYKISCDDHTQIQGSSHHVTNPAKMAYHSKIFTRAIHLKYSEKPAISKSIYN